MLKKLYPLQYIVNHPFRVLTISLSLLTILSAGIFNLKPSFNHKAWFNQTDPAVKEYDQFSQIFGNDDFITVILKTKGSAILDRNLDLIRDITEQASMIPNVIRVESLTNYEFIESEGSDVNIISFSDLTDDKGYNFKRDKVKSDEALYGTLISKDFKTTLINIRINEMDQGALEYERSENAIREIMQQIPQDQYLSFEIGGTVPVNNSLSSSSLKDINFLMPIAIAIILLSIFAIFRSFKVAFILGLELACSIAGTMGFLGYLGVKISPIISMVPIIIASIALADSIHIIQAFRQNLMGHDNRVDRLIYALKKVLLPSILTTATTSFGFFSLTFSDIKPISDLGIGGSVGVLIAWFTSMFLVAALILILKVELKPKSEFSLSSKIPKFIFKNRAFIFLGFIIFTGLSLNFGIRNEVNSNMIRYFDEDAPVRVANETIKDKFGGYSSLEILIDTKVADGIKSPVLLEKIENFNAELASMKHIVRVDSMLSIVKKINNALDNSGEVVPDTEGKIAETLLLYEISRPVENTFNNWYSQDYSKARIKALWDVEDSKTVNKLIVKVQALIDKHGLPGKVTGKSKLLASLDDYIIKTFVVSFTTSFFLIAMVMFLLTKSPMLAFISFIPNILPIFAGMWVLYLLGGVIDVGVVLFGAITIGIAIDDTIFFLTDYSKYLRKGHSTIKSVGKVLISSGESLFNTTSVLALGFACFIFGDFVPNQNFGIITAFVLTYALLCDLVMLPVILYLVNDVKKWLGGMGLFGLRPELNPVPVASSTESSTFDQKK